MPDSLGMMAPTAQQPSFEHMVWYYILGGLFLGFWFIFALVEDPDWFSWGMIGLLIATALYGARVSNDSVKIALWVLVGISIGGLIALMFIEEEVNVLATLITGTGAGLIAAGLPTPGGPAYAPAPPTHAPSAARTEPAQEENGEPQRLQWTRTDEPEHTTRRAS